jgi:hypothetical protein
VEQRLTTELALLLLRGFNDGLNGFVSATNRVKSVALGQNSVQTY